ncbi:hypothetical protein CHUAL_014012 [Chamberlinius hualienensis]
MKNVGYFVITLLVLLQAVTQIFCGDSSTTSQTPAIQIPCGFLDNLFSFENGVWSDGCTTCTCVLGFAKCQAVNNCEPPSNESHSGAKLEGGRRRRRHDELNVLFE